jgi:hypothetical protein
MNNSVGTSQTVVPASSGNGGLLQIGERAASQAYQNGTPSATQARSALEAYRAEVAARNQMAQQQQQGSMRATDILA